MGAEFEATVSPLPRASLLERDRRKGVADPRVTVHSPPLWGVF